MTNTEKAAALQTELARLIRNDIATKGLSERKIRANPDSYPFTSSIERQLLRGQCSLKRIAEIADHLGVEIEYSIKPGQ